MNRSDSSEDPLRYLRSSSACHKKERTSVKKSSRTKKDKIQSFSKPNIASNTEFIYSMGGYRGNTGESGSIHTNSTAGRVYSQMQNSKSQGKAKVNHRHIKPSNHHRNAANKGISSFMKKVSESGMQKMRSTTSGINKNNTHSSYQHAGPGVNSGTSSNMGSMSNISQMGLQGASMSNVLMRSSRMNDKKQRMMGSSQSIQYEKKSTNSTGISPQIKKGGHKQKL